MLNSINAAVKLSNGVSMPMLGLGTWQVPDGKPVEQAVSWALEVGYRHIDTAAAYGNETGVGKAVRSSGIPRDQIFVTTKVWNEVQRAGTDSAIEKAFEESLKKMGADYIDLYLIHWPVPGQYLRTWRVMERLYKTGRTKAIGVSNFLVGQLRELLPTCEIKPMVDQVEFHPRLMQRELMDLCRKEKIVQEAWSPLMLGKVFDISELQKLAKIKGKSIAQIVLRWSLQHGVVTIPKSIHKNRIEENARLFDFELSGSEMAQIDALDRNHRTGGDPNNFQF